MAVPTECPRCGYSYLTEEEFLSHISLSCQKCGWSGAYAMSGGHIGQGKTDQGE